MPRTELRRTELRRPHVAAAAIVAVVHVVGWGSLFAGASAGGAPAGTALALGLTAYTLGLRHAFDPDHVAAIDSTTRRLLERGRGGLPVGLWFSAGHSLVVVALCAAVAAGTRALLPAVRDPGSALHRVTGVWGPAVSSAFLVLVALVAVAALVRIARGGAPAGPVWRLLERSARVVDRPSRMFAVGLLFGLGFDTATEIGLLGLAGSTTAAAGAAAALSGVALALVFAAGMMLGDTSQSSLAARAYRRALTQATGPRWALLVTAASVAVSLTVAGVQIVQLAGGLLPGTLGRWAQAADVGALGYWFSGFLALVWAPLLIGARRRSRLGPTAVPSLRPARPNPPVPH